MIYDLSHLNQNESQDALGPIQDDEALLLYACIRTMRIHNIIEIGGLSGYSAKNFSQAIINGKIYTVDLNPVPVVSDNHIVITKDCRLITKEDVSDNIDMIFFDAHVYNEQIEFYNTLKKNNIINEDEVLLALHDTNLHPSKVTHDSYYIEKENGWCHQPVERKLVNHFKQIGFDSISFHTNMNESTIPYRHGLTLMKKYKHLDT